MEYAASKMKKADRTRRDAEPYRDEYNDAYNDSVVDSDLHSDISEAYKGYNKSIMRNPYAGTVPGAISVEYIDFTPETRNDRMGYIVKKVHKLMNELASDPRINGKTRHSKIEELSEIGPDDSVSQMNNNRYHK